MIAPLFTYSPKSIIEVKRTRACSHNLPKPQTPVLLLRRLEIGGISLIDMESRVFMYCSLLLSVVFVLFVLNVHKHRRKCLFCVPMNIPLTHCKKRVNVRKLLNFGPCMPNVRVLRERLHRPYAPVKCEGRGILDKKRRIFRLFLQLLR